MLFILNFDVKLKKKQRKKPRKNEKSPCNGAFFMLQYQGCAKKHGAIQVNTHADYLQVP